MRMEWDEEQVGRTYINTSDPNSSSCGDSMLGIGLKDVAMSHIPSLLDFSSA